MTKIAFDAKRMVNNATGLGNYARTLVGDLSRLLPDDCEMLLYSPDAGNDRLRTAIREDHRTRLVTPTGHVNTLQKALWRSWGIVKDLRRDNVSLYHGLSGELPWGIRAAGLPCVVTIHDLIFMRHPEYYNPIDVAIYKAKFRIACREASRIIAISKRTAMDIMELGGVTPDRIDVIYQSCGKRFGNVVSEEAAEAARLRHDLPARYVLNVGTIEERKNVMLAVKALAALPQDVHLVVVGRRTRYTDKVERYARQHSLDNRLHILSGVGDGDLQAIYQSAESFVYPSRYEGFGLPIIEAIQCKLPVVACTGSCLEEAGGPDCLYVHPDDHEALAAAIAQTLRGAPNRDARIMKSREYVRRFENNDTAKRVMETYERLGIINSGR